MNELLRITIVAIGPKGQNGSIMAGKNNKEREKRIENEVVVDAYDSAERAMGWYSYLELNISPFTAICAGRRPISPLKKGDEVQVSGMAPEDECMHEMFVMIRWGRDGLAIPLSQLKPGEDADDATRQAVEDWLYWVKQGYEL
jgi:hypothetical protein